MSYASETEILWNFKTKIYVIGPIMGKEINYGKSLRNGGISIYREKVSDIFVFYKLKCKCQSKSLQSFS